MPTKSACARAGWFVASVSWSEGLPKTCATSPVANLFAFSSSILAVPTPPKSQPARVYGTQGAGVFFWPSVIMFGRVLSTGSTGFVQYLKELVNLGTLVDG